MRKFGFAIVAAISLCLAGLQVAPAQAAVPACSAPTISGSVRVGVTLTSATTCSNTPTAYTYQWKSATTSTGTYSDIVGATQSTYAVQPVDAAHYLKLSVTATNSSGTSAVATTTTGVGPALFASEAFVGSATAGTTDGVGAAAGFTGINGMTSDGTFIYVVDYTARLIKKIDSGGTVTTIAGDNSAAAAVVDGVGTQATFKAPNGITYNSASNSLFIKDASVVRELDLTTGAVTTLQSQATILSVSKSTYTVTLTFAAPHGLYSQAVTVSGLGAPYDGTFTVGAPSATTITYNVATLGNVATFNPTGAKVVADLGPSRTDSNLWWHYYEAFDVAPDGRLYIGRSNSGVTDNQRYVLRLTRITGSTFRYERLFFVGGTPCAFQFVSNTSMYMGSCYAYNLVSTTDDWATVSYGTSFGTTINSGLIYDSGSGYVYIASTRYDSATATQAVVLAVGSGQLQLWAILGDTLYSAAQSSTQITKYVGAASGQPVAPQNLSKTVTFDSNGGTGYMQPQVASGSANLTANAYAKSGFTFAGWNTLSNGGGTSFADAASFTFAADTTLYAQWTATTYTVTYSVPAGVTVPTQAAISAGSTFSLAAAPSRAGYTFNKWNDGTSDHAASSNYTIGAAAVTLTATWIPDAYAVTFDSQLGSAVAQSSFTTGGSLTLPAAPTRNGYNFMGWFAAASGGSALPSPYTPGVITPITLYAQWTNAPTYAVTYSVPPGVSAPTQGAVVSGGTFLTATGPSRPGYTFVKWNDGSNDYNAGASFTMSATAVTLTAIWSLDTYVVSFDSQSGSAVSSSSFSIGSSVTLPSAPTRAGYTFDGWFAASTGGTALSSPYTPGVLSAITLYAQWTPVAQSSNNQLNNQSQQSSTASDSAPRIVSATRPTGVLSATVTIRISGYNLESVSAFSSSGAAKIVEQGAAILIVSVELQQLGKGALTLSSTGGSVTLLDAFNCVASTLAPSAISVITLDSVYFAADSSKLSLSQAAKLRLGIASISGKIQVSITGKTAGTKVTPFDRALALARAKSVAKAISAAVGNARMVLRIIPSAGAKASSRIAEVSVSANTRP